MPRSTPEVELSVVMPCLDEAETLETCIRKAQAGLRDAGVVGEVVIADNGSTDGSVDIATRCGARVVPVESRGYGAALLGGIRAARGRYVVMGDADDSYDFSDLTPFLERLRGGAAMVIGNRFSGEIRPGAMPPLHRYLGNPVLSAAGRLFFRSPVRDFHCGLRAFDREAVLDLDLRTTGMEFASEMVVKATLHGLRIDEVPIVLSPDGRSRPPHLRSWRDGWRHLRFLLLYSPRWLFLYPGLALMALGTLFGLWLIPGGRTIGTVGLDVQTLLYACMAVVIGYQSVMFAVFSKVYAISEGYLPPDERVGRMFKVVTLETGLVVGLTLVGLGLGGSVWGFLYWGDRSFGALDSSQSLRIVIPSVTALVLGFQTVLSSFFLSLMGMRHR